MTTRVTQIGRGETVVIHTPLGPVVLRRVGNSKRIVIDAPDEIEIKKPEEQDGG